MEKRVSDPSTAFVTPIQPMLRPQVAAFVRINALDVHNHQEWVRLIRERVAPNYRRYSPLEAGKNDQTSKQAMLKLIIVNFPAISEIWSQSDFVNDAELAPTKTRKPLTRHSLGRVLYQFGRDVGEKGDMSAYESRANRLVDAMLSFVLLEEQCDRANKKPLIATQLLNQVMIAHSANHIRLLSRAFDGAARVGANDRVGES